VRAGAEITVEANPDSLDAASLEHLRAAGANRISLGVQSFDDGVLRFLGRAHDASAAWRVCELVRESGFELSVDLMCGVPAGIAANAGHWPHSLSSALASGAPHLSVYPLQVEEGTPLEGRVTTGAVALPDEDSVADELILARDTLEARGLRRYEVANYARAGHEARHNTAYWLGNPYIGVGPAAHGMLDAATAEVLGLLGGASQDAARVRYAQARAIDGWLTGERTEVEVLTAREAARENVMLGLRLTDGVSADAVRDACVEPVLQGLLSDGLVEIAGDYAHPRWRVTDRGWLLGNEVFGRVWLADEDEGREQP